MGVQGIHTADGKADLAVYLTCILKSFTHKLQATMG